MATVGDIAVTVGADIADLKRGMQTAENSVSKFSKKSEKSLSRYAQNVRKAASMTAKLGAAGAAAGAAIVTGIVAKQAPLIDSLAKTSDALGLTTERLQALNHLAQLNGVSSESMSKGIRRLQTNLGMAARSGGASARALEDVGVNINDILKLRPDKQITALSEAIAKVDNQALRASIATDLFGRDGVAMLKVLNQIEKDGLEPTVEKLKEFGVAITRVDAAKVEAANDAFFKAKEIISGTANTLTVELSPFIQEAADRFIDAARESKGFGDEIQSAISAVIRSAGKLGNVMQGLKVVFKGVELIGVGFGAAVATVVERVSENITSLLDLHLKSVNFLIENLNRIPNVDIAKVDLFGDSPFMEGLRGLGDAARNQVSIVRSELSALAEQRLPSDKIEDFLASVQQKSTETAAAVAQSVDEMQQAGIGTFTIEPTLLEEQAAILKEHFDQLQMIANDGFGGIEGIMRKSWGVATSETAGAMKSVVNTLSTSSRKAFEISKAWGIADALVSTYQGIAAGVKLGWPMAIPAVAWAAANGFAQVSAIKAQKFGGAGGGGAASSGSASQATPPQSAQPQQQRLTVDSINPGDLVTGGTFNSVMEQIQDFTADGGQVVMGA